MATDGEAGPAPPPAPGRAMRAVVATLELGVAWATRFVAVQGVDRAAALGARAFTAMFPLLIVYATVVPGAGSADFADAIVERLRLQGAAASSVEQAFAPTGTVDRKLTAVGVVLLVVAALSFTRALQRLYTGSYRLPPLGLRGVLYGLAWLVLEGMYLALRPAIVGDGHGVRTAVLSLALGAVLWLGTPYLLLGRRLPWRRLVTTAVLTGVAMTVVGAATVIWLPRSVESTANQFGIIGVAFALLTWLVGVGFALVIAATGGAVLDERLRRDGRSPDDGPLGPDAPDERVGP